MIKAIKAPFVMIKDIFFGLTGRRYDPKVGDFVEFKDDDGTVLYAKVLKVGPGQVDHDRKIILFVVCKDDFSIAENCDRYINTTVDKVKVVMNRYYVLVNF